MSQSESTQRGAIIAKISSAAAHGSIEEAARGELPGAASSEHIEVMHGVNLDMLGQRDPEQYGTLTLVELERQISRYATELDLEVGFFHTNFEGEFVERLHHLRGRAGAVILNPGAWSHYSWAIHDALEIAAIPACEVHLSDIKAREPWRAISVVEDLCLLSVAGQGAEGYRQALERLREELGETDE